jgi:DNA mismatch repair ATPase MutS
VSFGALMVVHARVLNANERVKRARRFYERGVSRLDGTWAGTGADGARFTGDHIYAGDLDLFGSGSLFQLIDTARTEAGEETLADWLRGPAGLTEVNARQAAVAELRNTLDFREGLAVLAAETHVSRTGSLSRWATTEPVGLGSRQAMLFAACALANAVAVTAMLVEWTSSIVVLACLAVTGTVALLHRARVWQVIRGVDAAADDLSLLEALLQRLEQQRFSTTRLTALCGAFDGQRRPSALIAQLRRYIAARDALRNEFVRPFGLLLLVRSQAAVAIDRWHAAHRHALAGWITAIGEFEALSSFATYAFEHPADPFPTIAAEGPVFEATALGHPLLPERTAARNDVALGGAASRVLIVSGSNMSGKSTLLRSVGANVVLALAGAPVRAERLVVSPLAVGASIRVEDSLQQGHSRFYAEILRIRAVVQLTQGDSPALFLLDEILHGTNSHDRKIGAEAVIRALVDGGAIGLVTTHDLALTTLAQGTAARARNVHFEDRIENGRMIFDYRMRDGVVERSNALELMRAVGLDV